MCIVEYDVIPLVSLAARFIAITATNMVLNVIYFYVYLNEMFSILSMSAVCNFVTASCTL
jgi:hypothetical protein